MTLSALILAGGHSTRMGQDKALLAIEGIPMLRRVCEVALACTPEVAVITPWPDRYQDIMPQGCRFIQEQPLPREDFSEHQVLPPSHGPLVGFAQGLEQVQTEWVLLLACDLPRLDPAALQQWSQNLTQVSEEAIAYLSKQPAGWEPLCGFYRRRCLPNLQAYIAQGKRAFQGWLNEQPVAELPAPDAALFFNCNTPEDLAQLQ